MALAVGNPLGHRADRHLRIIAQGARDGLSDGSFETFIQTDAAITEATPARARQHAGAS